MWASSARFVGSCESRVLCMDWQESSSGEGGWLVTGCANSNVGVSWINNNEAGVKRNGSTEPEEKHSPINSCAVHDEDEDADGEEEEQGGGGEGEEGEGGASKRPVHRVRPCEDNCACTKEACLYKSHFILRGHTGEVKVVRWMPDGDRLASYDSLGKLIIWRNRANVLAYELSIKTSLLFTDMQWSPCGYYIFLCGRDGHVQSFSTVTGRNLFSIQVEATRTDNKKAEFTCCAWNRPGTRVALGTENGEVVIIDPSDNGRSVSTICMHKGISVQSLEWYGPVTMCKKRNEVPYESQCLSAYLKNGDVMFFESLFHSDVHCNRTGVVDGTAEWNFGYSLMAVIGYKKSNRRPIAKFLNNRGYAVFTLKDGLPSTPHERLYHKNVIWGLNDSAIFASWGSSIYSIEVCHSLPSLQFLARHVIKESIEEGQEKQLQLLPLPKKEIMQLSLLKAPIVPVPFNIQSYSSLEALMQPVSVHQRIHCKLESTEDGYLLKYEHFHNYIPLLHAKKKRSSFIHGGYRIEPAFDCSFLQNSTTSSRCEDQATAATDHHWATRMHPRALVACDQVASPQRRSKILRQLRSAFQSSLSQGVMDVSTQQRLFVFATTGGPNRAQSLTDLNISRERYITAPKRPLLAEIDGNVITNRFRFRTGCSLFQDGILGSLKITTNYIKCQPRKMVVHLTGPAGKSAETSAKVAATVGDESHKSSTAEGREGEAGETSSDVSLFSRDPDWNDRYHIYELDFGGRVSMDSIKNFQIERDGRVVMQFGRSCSKRFSLDFEAPFSPVQAFCVALACIL